MSDNKKFVDINNLKRFWDDAETHIDNKISNSLNRLNTDGMGYLVLDKDKPFEDQVTQENTIYEIRYDFDLRGGW